jgi:large subunit ribosomal protein L18
MFKTVPARVGRQRRHLRVRAKISGTAERPRLCVFRSSANMYAQLVNDLTGQTLAAASTLSPELKELPEKGKKSVQAASVGKLLAEKAKGDRKSVV